LRVARRSLYVRWSQLNSAADDVVGRNHEEVILVLLRQRSLFVSPRERDAFPCFLHRTLVLPIVVVVEQELRLPPPLVLVGVSRRLGGQFTREHGIEWVAE
jgi:hypothetical protein